MVKIYPKGVAVGLVVALAIAMSAAAFFWPNVTPPKSTNVKPIDTSPVWTFHSTKDSITDETYTSMTLSGEGGSALLAIRCEKMVDINGANVPIYTMQVATSDYLGKTDSRTTFYRVNSEQSVSESWIYSDKNAEQIGPQTEAEVVRRAKLVNGVLDGKALKIRLRNYKYDDRDYAFQGRDPNGANIKLLIACGRKGRG